MPWMVLAAITLPRQVWWFCLNMSSKAINQNFKEIIWKELYVMGNTIRPPCIKSINIERFSWMSTVDFFSSFFSNFSLKGKWILVYRRDGRTSPLILVHWGHALLDHALSSSRTLVQAPGYMHEKTTHKAPRPMQNYFDLLLLFRRPLSTFYFFETLVHLKSFEKIWPGFLSNLWPRVRPRIWSRVWHWVWPNNTSVAAGRF